MSDPREGLRKQLSAHGCDWLIDAGADLHTCQDAIVYLDAKEEGRSAEAPRVEAIAMFDRSGRRTSQPVLIPEASIEIEVFGGIFGYQRLRIEGGESVQFSERLRVKQGMRLRVSKTADGEISFDNLEEVTFKGMANPRVNLMGRPQAQGTIGGFLRRFFRR